jgi:Ca2+-binding EF-hand superfamily protein
MKDEQLYEFTQRFESLAVNDRMDYKKYRESLGLFGMESLAFMADRMFAAMDQDKSGDVSLCEYLTYIDIMMYGEEDERLQQSFGLMDLEGRGYIKFRSFRKIITSFAQMWSAALGQPTPVNLEHFRTVFE